jgi:dTDP-4-amino-4,6-dideoxygalactose transaminase
MIPFNRPHLTGRESLYMQEALASGHLSGGGPFGKKAEVLLAAALGSKAVLLTTSCTHALEMCAMLLDIKPGDEVILPSFTFVSTANAFALHGAKIVFADIRADTLNIDVDHVERLITPSTRVVIPVHYGGVACDMHRLDELQQKYGFDIVEDNAHGLFGSLDGKPLGAFGRLSTLSFHDTKNYVCGEGGALVINDSSLVARAEIIREKGTNRSRFLRGEIDKYTWVDLGSSYVMSDILAAFLLAQLESRDDIMRRRRKVVEHYDRELADWAMKGGVTLPTVPGLCTPPHHLYYLLLPSARHQAEFIAHMKSRDIRCTSHYVPLHSAPQGLKQGDGPSQCPVTEAVAERLVRLPLFADMNSEDLRVVTEAALAFVVS